MQAPFRFGSYELDPVAGELRKAGVRVQLSGQPLDVLALLVRRPGQVVTREELKETLWPDETFVDFDNGVNSAIRRIRRALDDSATDPRFIETLPKRGYRFVADVDSPQAEAAIPDVQPSSRRLALLILLAALVVGAMAPSRLWLWPRPDGSASGVLSMGEPIPLTTLPGIERDPTFSPDGSQVAFAWNGTDRQDFDIYVKSVSAGHEPLQLTDDPADDIMPAWSPDGQTIAFWRSQGDQSGIYLVSPQGKNERQLLGDRPAHASNQDSSRHTRHSWSPDSKWIAFTDTAMSSRAVVAISVETGESKVLTDAAGRDDLFPAFSPDGASLAWARTGGEGKGIVIMDLASGKVRRLADSPASLAWSADSDSLFTMAVRTASPLQQVRVEDGERKVAPAVRGAGPLSISASGDRLAYARRFRNLDVLAIDVPTPLQPASEPHLVLASTTSEAMAQISPDGSRVALLSGRSGRPQIWIAGRDGSGARELPMGGAALRWSPDGEWVAFDRPTADSPRGIYVTDRNGGRRRLVTDSEKYAVQPCWSEDGESIFFAQGSNEANARIWRAPVGGGEARQVTTGRGIRCWAAGGLAVFRTGLGCMAGSPGWLRL